MSAYLVLVAVVLAAAALVTVAHLVRYLRSPREERRAARVAPRPARQPSRDWDVLSSRFRPALLALVICAAGLPLVLWGVALRDPAVGKGAFWVGVSVVVVLAVAGVHAWRRGGVLR